MMEKRRREYKREIALLKREISDLRSIIYRQDESLATYGNTSVSMVKTIQQISTDLHEKNETLRQFKGEVERLKRRVLQYAEIEAHGTKRLEGEA